MFVSCFPTSFRCLILGERRGYCCQVFEEEEEVRGVDGEEEEEDLVLVFGEVVGGEGRNGNRDETILLERGVLGGEEDGEGGDASKKSMGFVARLERRRFEGGEGVRFFGKAILGVGGEEGVLS